MGVIQKLSENIKRGLRSWLNVMPANPYSIQINEVMDFEVNAIRNRIWYRGDGNELEQLYGSVSEYADKYKFWASKCSRGMEMRKIHTGLPSLIVKTLVSVTLSDMNDFEFKKPAHGDIWSNIENENSFRKNLEANLRELLFIGDGAFKITMDSDISKYPVLEWYPGERIELVYRRGRLHEVVFKTLFREHRREYILCERYGFGYIKSELCCDGKPVDMSASQLLAILNLLLRLIGRRYLQYPLKYLKAQNIKTEAEVFSTVSWTASTPLTRYGRSGWTRCVPEGRKPIYRRI